MALYTLDKLTKEEEEEILAKGAARRIAKAHALGLPTTHSDGGGIYRLYPDGRKVYITEEEKRAYEELKRSCSKEKTEKNV